MSAPPGQVEACGLFRTNPRRLSSCALRSPSIFAWPWPWAWPRIASRVHARCNSWHDSAMAGIDIHEDMAGAWARPGAAYRDAMLHERIRERVFVRSWQLVGDETVVQEPGAVLPLRLLPGCLDEPLVLARDADGTLRCLSNVCTHRGNLVVSEPGHAQGLRCGYHGRRFGLDGRLLGMPEFDGVVGFPAPSDDLPAVALERAAGRFLFASLDPAFSFADLTRPLSERLAWYPFERLVLAPDRCRDYEVAASWVLYCDNYLEGVHIPFVHAELARAGDYGEYTTELYPYASLQLAIAASGQPALEPPPGARDHERRVAAYYFFLFPNTMFNFYPWGLSINVVVPLAVDRTRISYLTYVADPALLERGAGGALDRVEREDEAIIEKGQVGVGARLYRRGRYSPKREAGVHHYHRLLARLIS